VFIWYTTIIMFRTELHIPHSLKKLSLKHPVLLIGSCFSTNIGALLEKYKFNCLTNPFGTVFNPISINKLLNTSLSESSLPKNGYGINQGLHFHYDLHSQFSSLEQEKLIKKTNQAVQTTNSQLQTTKWIIISWGTAIVYENKKTGEVVNNCHKVPSKNFNKRMLSAEKVVADFENLLTTLPNDINIILTVSPVRHIKETLELNNVSKATLRLAAHELSEKHTNIHYFPSFELMMDDLRDYRFYKSDMLHPSEEAIMYIWQKFTTAFFDDSTQSFIKEWDKIANALNHKPFNPHSDEHQKFLKKIELSLQNLKYTVDTSKELQLIHNQILN